MQEERGLSEGGFSVSGCICGPMSVRFMHEEMFREDTFQVQEATPRDEPRALAQNEKEGPQLSVSEGSFPP